MNCAWKITAAEGTQIQLRFSDFKLERDSICQNDRLEIFDGPSYNSPMIGEFCDDQIDDLIVSSSNHMYIRLSTDNSDVFRGFEAFWLAVHKGFVMRKKHVKRQAGMENY